MALGILRATELDSSAKDAIAFLRGVSVFHRLRFADTVVFYVTPEGGGGRKVVTRDELRRRSNWTVQSGRATYSFVPPPGMAKLTTKVGRHFNCLEYALSSRLPEVARFPHVAVKLEPENAESCLQSWNITLVFDSTARPPRLIAAVYDQWEW